jgi:predicted hotdog family 3-hydroxylacyl-ACP dehydratase
VPREDPVFEGHFPGAPLFPGVLQLEVMAQAAGVFLMAAHRGTLMPFLVGVEQARFRRPTAPGAQLVATARLGYGGERMAAFECSLAQPAGPTASAHLRLSLAPPPNELARSHVAALLRQLGVAGGQLSTVSGGAA